MTRPSAVARPVTLTFASEAASVLATVWVTRRLAISYSAAEIAVWLVLRQVLGWVVSVGMLGLNVSLPRALAAAGADRASRRRDLAAALLLVAPIAFVLVVVPQIAPRLAATVLLHDPAAGPLLQAGGALIAANAFFAVAAASLQGLDRFGTLALARVGVFVLGPVATVGTAAGRMPLPSLLWLWSAASLAFVAASSIVVRGALGPAQARAGGSAGPWLVRTAHRLVGYGGPRMIGAVVQLSTTLLAPMLALWCGAPSGAAAALSVAAMFGVLLGPVRLALQPVGLTRLAAARDARQAEQLARDYLAASACAAAAACAALVLDGDRLVGLWLGPAFALEATVLRISIAAVCLQFFCYAMEGVLDAADPRHERPRAQFAGALAFAACALVAAVLHTGAVGIAIAQLVAAVVQVALYVRATARRYGLPRTRELVHGAVTVGVGCLVAGLLARRTGAGLRGVAVLVGAQAVAALALIGLARVAGARWMALGRAEPDRLVAPADPS